jgi:hypothetical protein
LARKLADAEAKLALRKTRITPAPGASWARLNDLVNVSIEPGRLLITWDPADPEACLRELWTLSQAIGNQYEKFLELIQPATGDQAANGDHSAASPGYSGATAPGGSPDSPEAPTAP